MAVEFAPNLGVCEFVARLLPLQFVDRRRPDEASLDPVGSPLSRLGDADRVHDANDREERSLEEIQVPIGVRRTEVLPKDLREP
jgi:hypothetical protein